MKTLKLVPLISFIGILLGIYLLAFVVIPDIRNHNLIYESAIPGDRISRENNSVIVTTPSPTLLPSIPAAKEIPTAGQVYQTFNNCGPASLSMLLRYYDQEISQAEIGNALRPYQHPTGDNDDKSVSFEEFADYVEKLGFVSYHRPGGDLELLKKFVSAGYPVIVRTWLNPGEDIGHFRIVRGYDDIRQQILQDDSYQGPNRWYGYEEFEEMWRPFQYEFFVIGRDDQVSEIEFFLGNELVDSQLAWQKVLHDNTKLATDQYDLFNQSVAAYYLGDFERSVQLFEESQTRLPKRMLWYQIEPIMAYQKLGNNERVFSLTNSILNNHNRGFSELYLLRGQVYEADGNSAAARIEYEQAVKYNIHWLPAQEALKRVS